MQLDTRATNATLATAWQTMENAIAAIDFIDVSSADDAARELLRDRLHIVEAELQMRGVRVCGRCPVGTPGAVDWGCTCDMTAEELAAGAQDFARIHD